MKSDLSVHVVLSNLNGAIITKEEVGGVEEEGIFIPIRFNTIFKKKNGEYTLNLRAIENKPNEFGYLYGLLPTCSKKKKKELEELGQKTGVFCGNITRSTKHSILKKNKFSIEQALKNE